MTVQIINGPASALISASTVVTGTWDAITGIAAPAPEGGFHDEWTTIKDITTGEEFWIADFPVEIDVGHTVQGNTTAENTGTSTYRARVIAYFLDPNGDKVGEDIGPWRDFAPGDYYIKLTTEITLDFAGSWQFEAVLEAE